MKSRIKKLTLNRETLRTLQEKELPQIRGGVIAMYCYTDTCTCETWCYRCIQYPYP